ncbi:GAF and ANTAR domain-containing protein [Nitriliruptor alkaliphilus]|uniref:GAF and ANTAR domain-containing protein n=1 Tax=Nitriliruptor alkaliphilus TaxID=427918 RepID=UPI000695D1DD|nr:GAF and ANTAR domain-containing protein [Nitriliruptor alkaliphilus]
MSVSSPDPVVAHDGLRRFAGALRDLASTQYVDETLQLAVDLATELVSGCDVADVMFLGAGGTTTPVSTDPVAIALDEAQGEHDEGPCIAAARNEPVVVSHDLAADERWPSFGPRAVAMGVNSAASYQLFLHRHERDRLGALNLYSRQPDAFDADAVVLGEVFAAQCSAALAAAIAKEGAAAALESRDRIGQAKGILMERERISATEAFDELRRTSQELNIKLRDVAEHVARTGALP